MKELDKVKVIVLSRLMIQVENKEILKFMDGNMKKLLLNL